MFITRQIPEVVNSAKVLDENFAEFDTLKEGLYKQQIRDIVYFYEITKKMKKTIRKKIKILAKQMKVKEKSLMEEYQDDKYFDFKMKQFTVVGDLIFSLKVKTSFEIVIPEDCVIEKVTFSTTNSEIKTTKMEDFTTDESFHLKKIQTTLSNGKSVIIQEGFFGCDVKASIEEIIENIDEIENLLNRFGGVL